MPGDSVEVADWLAKSAEDCLAAGLLFPHGLHDLVGYLCQQSAEKALKALLVSLAVQPPYTHDLQQLWRLLADLGQQLAEIEMDCTLLKQYAVVVRYPGFGTLSRDDAAEAIEAAARVADAVSVALGV